MEKWEQWLWPPVCFLWAGIVFLVTSGPLSWIAFGAVILTGLRMLLWIVESAPDRARRPHKEERR